MAYPSVADDGRQVEIDLHGATVDEALSLIDRLIALAARRGRASVRVIHGTSTSDAGAWNRTIKHALYDAYEEGALGHEVTGMVRMDGFALLSLRPSAAQDSTRITILDL